MQLDLMASDNSVGSGHIHDELRYGSLESQFADSRDDIGGFGR